MDPHVELDTVLPFLLPDRRARWVELFTKPKGRKKLLDTLWHGRDIAPNALIRVLPTHAKHRELLSILRRLGAPEMCHLLSVRPHLDGQDLTLTSALEQVVGVAPGTIASCVPGKLAYYERDEENGRYILMDAEYRRHAKELMDDLFCS